MARETVGEAEVLLGEVEQGLLVLAGTLRVFSSLLQIPKDALGTLR